MRNVLHKHFRSLVDGFAKDLQMIAAKRVEVELERMTEAFAVALSAYESDSSPPTSDLLERALGPDLAAMMKLDRRLVTVVSRKTGRAKMEWLARRPESSPAPEPETVKTGACGAESGGASNWACQLPAGHEGWHYSKHVGGWGDPPMPIAAPKKDRDLKPVNVPDAPATARAGEQGAPRVPVNKGKTCSTCGYVGGNKRGCGKSHPTQGTPIAGVDIARDRSPIITVHSAPPDRRALIAARAAKPPAPAHAELEDEDDVDERWTAERLKEETALAESQKREGELPVPVSTFVVGGW